MARLNARRRRAIKLRATLIELAKSLNPSSQSEPVRASVLNGKYQGSLRSSHKSGLIATFRYSAPKSLRMGGKGKPGEPEPLIGGNGKAIRKGSKRWGQK